MSLFPFLSVERIDSMVDFFICVFAHGFIEFFGDMIQLYLPLGFADGGNNRFLDICADFLYFFMTVHYRTDHFVVGNLVRARFYH